jgi:hypothetical protein
MQQKQHQSNAGSSHIRILTGLGILTGVVEFVERESDLHVVKDETADKENEGEVWALLCPEPYFENFFPLAGKKSQMNLPRILTAA